MYPLGNKDGRPLKRVTFKNIINSYCADGAYLHHENIVSKKMS